MSEKETGRGRHLHDPDADLPDPAVDCRATCDERDFRTSNGKLPYELATFGDSLLSSKRFRTPETS